MGKPVKHVAGGVAWGSPEYLVERFGDMFCGARELSRSSRDAMAVRAAVGYISTCHDGMRVDRAYRVRLSRPDGAARDGVVVLLSVGLNGHGLQEDYLTALRLLVRTCEFRIFDCRIDARDDIAQVLLTYTPNGRAESLIEADKLRRKARGRGKRG